MIKGVNKRIIEINRPDSLYFEKAVFYLKPNVRELPGEVTSAEINRFIRRIEPQLRLSPSPFSRSRCFILIASALSALGILLVFLT